MVVLSNPSDICLALCNMQLGEKDYEMAVKINKAGGFVGLGIYNIKKILQHNYSSYGYFNHDSDNYYFLTNTGSNYFIIQNSGIMMKLTNPLYQLTSNSELEARFFLDMTQEPGLSVSIFGQNKKRNKQLISQLNYGIRNHLELHSCSRAKGVQSQLLKLQMI